MRCRACHYLNNDSDVGYTYYGCNALGITIYNETHGTFAWGRNRQLEAALDIECRDDPKRKQIEELLKQIMT
jgi:hypothetical protein